ncbi:MAG TPA: four helix bundle protein [Chitinophagaceae bacterium]
MNPERVKNNLIIRLSFEFALSAMKFCQKLDDERKYIIANQLLRSALSIGANVREAQNAESTADFIHKMKIACKEADESEYYLMLIENAYHFDEVKKLLDEIIIINRILNKIITTSQRNRKQKKPV